MVCKHNKITLFNIILTMAVANATMEFVQEHPADCSTILKELFDGLDTLREELQKNQIRRSYLEDQILTKLGDIRRKDEKFDDAWFADQVMFLFGTETTDGAFCLNVPEAEAYLRLLAVMS